MAEKRMFSKQIIDSDAFLEMPLSTQALYFHLSMRADDDGFLNNAKKVMKIIGANQNDYDLLVAKSFVIQFPDGICVIKHWRINNYLRKDRYTETIYQDEKALLTIKPNGRYSLSNSDDECDINSIGIPVVDQSDTQNRIDKNREEKNRVDKEADASPASYSFDKNSNVDNLLYVLENSNPIDDDLKECLIGWMEYKDERKPRSVHHYVSQRSIKSLITQFVSHCDDYGIEGVRDIVNLSISNQWQGVIWDKMARMPKKQEVIQKPEKDDRWQEA